MNQFDSSALINLFRFSSIKPDTASTPLAMANSTTVGKIPGTPGAGGHLSPENNQVLTKKTLQDLVRKVDPNEQLDEDVEEMLLQIADDFIRECGDSCLPARSASQVQHPGGEGSPAASRAPVDHVDPRIWL